MLQTSGVIKRVQDGVFWFNSVIAVTELLCSLTAESVVIASATVHLFVRVIQSGSGLNI
jgi:hypothetical protein